LIEAKSASRSHLIIHFGTTKEGEASVLPSVDSFLDALGENVAADVQEQTRSFYRKVFLEVLRAEHGTLAAVMPAGRNVIPARLREGVPLLPRISMPDRVRELANKTDSESERRLEASGTMVVGMLLSDGITLFGSDGTVRAYNIFVKHPREKETGVRPLGGARTRTFNVMVGLVGTELTAAFMNSQDGRVEVKRSKSK
jgi:hypothetical protein